MLIDVYVTISSDERSDVDLSSSSAGMCYIQGRPAVGFPDIYWLFDREEDLPPVGR